MSPTSPSVVSIGGCNGAGKSTVAPRVLQGPLAVSEFVNADVIARGLSAFNPERVAVAAARIMLGRLRELAAQRASFAFETTLASRSFAPWIRQLMATGYEFHCVYVWLATPELSVQRVADRVRRGGHAVPEPVVRRRYQTGLENFLDLYRPLATTWRVYDNTAREPRLVARGEREEVVEIEDATTWRRIEAGPPGATWREVAMTRQPLSRIGEVMRDGKAVDEAARQAVREAVLQHVRDGDPIVVERDGKIVWLSPEEVLRELREEGDARATGRG